MNVVSCFVDFNSVAYFIFIFGYLHLLIYLLAVYLWCLVIFVCCLLMCCYFA